MFIPIGRPKSIAELKNSISEFTAKDRIKIPIAVIDDEGFNYEHILRTHDFNIRVFDDVEDTKTVEAYAIVLCDIKGVAKKFNSKFEGAHLISEIRNYYPAKVIIAYSGHSFDPSFNKYFQMSDYVFKKDIDSDDWIEKLDKAIKEAVNPIYQWKKMRKFLLEKDVDLYHILRLENEYVKAFQNHESNLFPSKPVLKSLPEDIKTVILNFTSSIIFKFFIG